VVLGWQFLDATLLAPLLIVTSLFGVPGWNLSFPDSRTKFARHISPFSFHFPSSLLQHHDSLRSIRFLQCYDSFIPSNPSVAFLSSLLVASRVISIRCLQLSARVSWDFCSTQLSLADCEPEESSHCCRTDPDTASHSFATVVPLSEILCSFWVLLANNLTGFLHFLSIVLH
jgi:hypothetical protein